MSKHARFQALVLPHLDRLVQLAGRFGEDEAEDYVQETLTRAWVNFDQLADPDASFSWLCSILLNVASEKRRLQTRRRKLVVISRMEETHQEIVGGDEPTQLDQLVASEGRGEILELLESVPEEFALPVELHDMSDLKYRQIADLLKVPIGTVRSRISRGRQLLAALIAQRGRKKRYS